MCVFVCVCVCVFVCACACVCVCVCMFFVCFAVPGTEIGFVLDGSGSINESDFEKAKNFICAVMSSVWEKCYNVSNNNIC